MQRKIDNTISVKQRIAHRLLLSVFMLSWINPFLHAVAAPDLRKPVYTFAVYEDFDNNRKTDKVTVAISGKTCRLTAQFQDHKQTLPVTISEAATQDIDIVARDVNNNSYKDLVIVNKRTHRILSVVLNNCDGTFSQADSCLIAGDNFRMEFVQKKARGGGSGQFFSHKLPKKFLTNTSVCLLTQTSNAFYPLADGFAVPGKGIAVVNNCFKTSLPRSPPIL